MRTRRTQSSSDPVPTVHRSVLLHETIEQLAIDPSDVVVDATIGGAGHARAIAECLDEQGTIVGLDADAEAAEEAEAHLAAHLADVRPTVHVVHANFRTLASVLETLGIPHIDRAVFDLGWSARQLAAGRGFSFQKDEPLLMTYESHPADDAITARDIVNEWEEEHIADVLYGWGEERAARRIARAIVARRSEAPIETSTVLADVVWHAVPAQRRNRRIHPATKTFQALRIAVNDEIGAITDGLTGACGALASGGRIAVITFHSVEDRVVKQLFRRWKTEGVGHLPFSKPVTPTREEVRENPRARSAKLRVFERS